MWYILHKYTHISVYKQYNIHRILSDSGAMGMTKNKNEVQSWQIEQIRC